ncbi:MAG: hypothetical protein KUG77_04160, partial [Nannocystaceae bacterium]|nr:hypothetical protein [Nannocystaceae bacterium]
MSLSIAALALVAGLYEPAVPRISVHWDAPAGCPDAAAVTESVRVLSGADVVEGEDVDLVATGLLTLRDDGYGLSVTLASSTHTQVRQLEAADCSVLARAAALMIVVALDPVQVAARLPKVGVRPEPEAEVEVEVEAEPESEPEPEP